MTKNRRRDKTLTIRLTESEKANIEKKAAKAKMNLTEYIIAASNKSKIKVAEDTTPLLIELKRIGNNINQIATRANMDIYQRENFEGIRKELEIMNDNLCKIARRK